MNPTRRNMSNFTLTIGKFNMDMYKFYLYYVYQAGTNYVPFRFGSVKTGFDFFNINLY